MYVHKHIHTYTSIHTPSKPYDLSSVPPALKVESLFLLGLISLKAVVLKKSKKTTGNICTVFFRGTESFPLREECKISTRNLKS